MLRRPATTIKLTPEDISEYDDSVKNEEIERLQQQQQQQQQRQETQSHNFYQNQILQEHNTLTSDTSHNLKEHTSNQIPQQIIQTREERIGVNPNNTNS